jgi:hypothetical protein
VSSRCCNSTNRSHLSTIRLKFRSKAPFKKLSNLILGLRRGPWRFWGWVALTDWSWHQGVCRQWVERERSSRNWTGNYEDACLIWGDSKRTVEGFVSSDFGVWFLQDMPRDSCIATCIVGQWRWWYWLPACSPRGSASSLNRHLFARFNTICKVFVNIYIYIYIYILGQSTSCGTTFPLLTLRLWEDLSLVNVAVLVTMHDAASITNISAVFSAFFLFYSEEGGS